jgi:SPX domain protein involved in polyphosphate accumulation
MDIQVFKRYEKKFLLTMEQFALLLPEIKRHMHEDPYCLHGQTYHLRNVYYDTPDHQLISTSILGPKFKEKFRIRKYGTYGDGSTKVFLEVKRKITGVVTKRRVLVSEAEAQGFMEKSMLPERQDYFSKQILKELLYLRSIYDLKPAYFIAYDRLAFLDKDHEEFRVTFDSNIISRTQDFSFEHSGKGATLLTPGTILMEVKVGEGMPLWFTKLLSSLTIYLNHFSKYGKAFEKNMVKEIHNDV